MKFRENWLNSSGTNPELGKSSVWTRTPTHNCGGGAQRPINRGEMLEEFISESNLMIVNRGAKATFESSRYSSIIDITLCTKNMVRRIKDWKVSDQHVFSDHKRIRFTLSLEKPVSRKEWVLGRANWNNFRSSLATRTDRLRNPDFWTPETVEEEVSLLYGDINSSLSESCPRTRVRRKFSNKWWTPELTSLRRKARKLQKKAKAKDSQGNNDLWEEYKRARNDFVAAIKKAKRTSWRKFTEDASGPESMIKLTKAIFKKGGQTIGHLRRADGTFTNSREEILDTLMDAFFPDSKEPGNKSSPPARVFVNCTEITGIFSGEKVAMAFHSFKKKKAPGPDGIRPEILHHLDNDTLRRIARIYGASLQLGYVPRRWRSAKAVLIPKEGKKDYSNPRAYRPVSLTSFLFKGMERVIYWYLEEVGVVDNLSRHQHAFRKNYSTETVLSEVVDRIEKSVLRGSHTLGVFFDIEGAFDNVLLTKVLEGLHNKGVKEEVVNWYGHYLQNRTGDDHAGEHNQEEILGQRELPKGGSSLLLSGTLSLTVYWTGWTPFQAYIPGDTPMMGCF